jgi:hypothetical protein
MGLIRETTEKNGQLQMRTLPNPARVFAWRPKKLQIGLTKPLLTKSLSKEAKGESNEGEWKAAHVSSQWPTGRIASASPDRKSMARGSSPNDCPCREKNDYLVSILL